MVTSALEPDGQVFALYASHQGNQLLTMPLMAADADIDLSASLTPDGQRIYVTVVNRNTAGEPTLELSLRNFAGPAQSVARLLVPLTRDVKGTFVQRDETLTLVDGHKVTITIPPCGIARIRFGEPGLWD